MDFRIIGSNGGRRVWYRWKDGEITTNDQEGWALLRWMAKKRYVHQPPFSWVSPYRVYRYEDLFTDPLTFRVLVTKHLHDVERIEGDAPEEPPAPKTPDFLIRY